MAAEEKKHVFPRREPSKPLPLPSRFGRYRLTELLAQGGMAQIYLAKSFGAEGFVKQLVIKRLDPQLGREPFFTRLFIDEAKLLVTLNHGNIVPVFDFGRVEDDLFIAMEYVPGASLGALLSTLGDADEQLDVQLTAHVAAEIAKGLHYAHRKTDARGRPTGIVHRDIKPTNVLISLEGEVKIVDFGVAKLAGRLESRGRLAGTVAYMSPEQANRKTVDHRTDIFSTGLVLYEMLAGRRVYDAGTPRAMLDLARIAEMPTIGEHVPRELSQVAIVATQRRATDRYASAYEMEQALSEYLLLARAATAIFDSQSPSSKLSALMKRLRLGLDSGAEPLFDAGSDEPDDTWREAQEVGAGLEDIEQPPDLALIKNAAETFQSEFFTRVLEELDDEGDDDQGAPAGLDRSPRRPASWLLWGAIFTLLSATLALLIVVLVSETPSSRPTPKTVVANRATVVFIDAGGVRTDVAPASRPDAAAAKVERSVDARTGAVAKRAPTTPTKKKPRRPRHGYLNLNSIPWSRVKIDGRLQRRPTPLLKLRLRAGWHKVELFNRKRGLKKTLRVRVRAGGTTWKVVRLR